MSVPLKIFGTKFSKFRHPKVNIVSNMLKSTKSSITPLDNTRKEMKEIFLSGVEAVLPRTIIEKRLKLSDNKLFVGDRSFPINNNVYLIGFGKAVMNMVPGVEKLLGNRLKKGIISVPKGSKDSIWKIQDFENFPNLNGKVEFREGAKNNQPDIESLSTTDEIIDLVEKLKENDTLIVLISGGGSALLCMPRPQIELKEKQEFCKKLQQAGADIQELNIVRKKLSLIKGGGLARLAYPASVISLILSDIVGDPLAEIASGPTVYSEKSSDEVIKILKKYNLFDDLDWKIKSVVTARENTDIDKYLLDDKKQFKHVNNIIIGNSSIAIESAKNQALRKGFIPIILRSDVEGNVTDVSTAYAKIASLICMALEKKIERESFFNLIKEDEILSLPAEKVDEIYNLIENYSGQRIVLIGGGEPTVVVTGNGIGGRNQQLALQFSLDWLANVREDSGLGKYDVVMLSGGTDGQDGPNDAAGAFGYPAIAPIIHDLYKKLNVRVNQSMVENVNKEKTEDDELASKLTALEKLIPENVIRNNDAYSFYSRFKKGKDLLKTGLTGTNVMDLHIISIKKEECGCKIDFQGDTECRDPLEEHYLDSDPAEFEKEETAEAEKSKREQELLNLKILDTDSTEACCKNAKKE